MESDRFLEREELIHQVEQGLLTPDQAQEKATIRGIGNLLPQPNIADYDPMSEARWSMVMAVVWISVRNETAVRNSWNEFRLAQWEWWSSIAEIPTVSPKAIRKKPYFLNSIPIEDRLSEYKVGERTVRSLALSLTLLRRALRNGALSAFGRDLRGHGDVVAIPALNWDALVLTAPNQGGGGLLARPPIADEETFHLGDGRPAYSHVSVERQSLLAAFPPSDGTQQNDRHLESSDPIKAVTDRSDNPGVFRSDVRRQALREAFPNGVPKGMPTKERNKILDEKASELDPSVSPANERQWRELVKEYRQLKRSG